MHDRNVIPSADAGGIDNGYSLTRFYKSKFKKSGREHPASLGGGTIVIMHRVSPELSLFSCISCLAAIALATAGDLQSLPYILSAFIRVIRGSVSPFFPFFPLFL